MEPWIDGYVGMYLNTWIRNQKHCVIVTPGLHTETNLNLILPESCDDCKMDRGSGI
jgi:hypothetical protein